MDTKFSSAIHALILISESETPMNSEQIAASVGTNASYIRKLMTRLRKAEIIEGRRGISGFRLVRKPDDISFLDIYKSVMETDSLHLFDIHQNFEIWKSARKKSLLASHWRIVSATCVCMSMNRTRRRKRNEGSSTYTLRQKWYRT